MRNRHLPIIALVSACALASVARASIDPAQIRPMAPTSGDSIMVSLHAEDSDVFIEASPDFPFVSYSGTDIAIHFFCAHEPMFGWPPTDATAVIGPLPPGDYELHIWCWYESLMLYFPIEIETSSVVVRATQPTAVPALESWAMMGLVAALALVAKAAHRAA